MRPSITTLQTKMISLYDHQRSAMNMLRVGSILCGGVGSGKSRTALAFFYEHICGGDVDAEVSELKTPTDLYIITTARKRDTFDWQKECAPFLLSTDAAISLGGVKVVVDSWNNIEKYTGSKNAFFIFDEQRVVGSGVWVKSFIKIAKQNKWILLSATPGDTWGDYVPVFIANGFFRNRTHFNDIHVVWKRFVKWPQIDRYINTERLEELRNHILINMEYLKKTTQHIETIRVEFDEELTNRVWKDRWHPFEERPINDAAEMCLVMRKIANSDPSRIKAIDDIRQKHPKLIVFYNFDYELDILRLYATANGLTFAEWNGHKHQLIPESEAWLYFVQYTAGAEGWNCIQTNAIAFYSLNYSYKIMIQSGGRIDRLDTEFLDLYLYRLVSKSPIDKMIVRALTNKKTFNERKFASRAPNTCYNRRE